MPIVTRVLALVVLASSVGLTESPESSAAVGNALARQRDDVEFLSSEQLRGRSVADDTIVEAAEYIAARMNEIGLKTDWFDGTPMQKVDIPLGARAGSVEFNQIVFRRDNNGDDAAKEPLSASLGSGMNPLAIGVSEGACDGPIAFVGYGITAPELGYDDYADVNVKGHVVMMVRKEPGNGNDERVFSGKQNTRHAFFATKIANAIRHGATAVILVNDSGSAGEGVDAKEKRLRQERERKEKLVQQIDQLPVSAVNSRESLTKQLAGVESMIGAAENELSVAESGLIAVAEAGEGTEKDKVIPVLSISRDLANRVLKRAVGNSLDAIEQKINNTVRPDSEILVGLTVDLSVKLEPTIASTANVIGVVPGRGTLADESVVIGAHYDHVGMGGFGSLAPGTVAVHNGADDNASGTAVLLASASQLRRRMAGLVEHRRVIFIAFTGEERGLVGSKYYAKHPRFPLESTVAMINLDMVGRLRDNELTLYGTGSGVGMNELVDRVNRRHGFDVYKVASGYGPSDHQSFYEMGVPVLFFFTGLHNDYHRPTDDFDKIDFGGMARITDMVSDVALEFATGKKVPTYAKTDDKVKIRRQMTAYLGVTLSALPDRVFVASVTAGAAGEQGGLRAGDTIEKIENRRVSKTIDVLETLRQHSPGEMIKIQVRRNNRVMTLPIKLDARPGSSQ